MKLRAQFTVLISSAMFAVGGFAFASTTFAIDSSNVIYACVTGVNGNITKVSNTPHNCPRNTTPISWNQQGIQGPAGPTGAKGDTGERGLAGQSGNSAAAGVPWYLADTSESAVLVPTRFDFFPQDGDFVAVVTNSLLASVDLRDGSIHSSSDVGDLADIFYENDGCRGGASSEFALPQRYILSYPEGSAFVGGNSMTTFGESSSARVSTLYQFLETRFLISDYVSQLPDFGVRGDSGCLSYTQEEFKNMFKTLYKLQVPMPQSPNLIAKWDMGFESFWSGLQNTRLRKLIPTDPIAPKGPLHIVSNF